MLKRLPFVLIIVALLLVLLAMTFAQDVPFHVEVIPRSANMRWGPGPTYVVQHYANAGHVLLVLEVDADSDPPWTWYYARTPSGAQSWIRSDLVARRADGDVPVQQRVSNPTGTYPVMDNNFCNTNLFRPCQEGTDHQLWESGYWARDRYNHWETGGWDLNTVYYLNPCRTDRLCPRREDWDAGRLEAEMLAVTMTPEATLTPFVITTTPGVIATRVVVWETIPSTDITTGTITLVGESVELDGPLAELTIGTGDAATIVGGFRFHSESVRVTCQFWHSADLPPGAEPVESRKFTISKFGDDDTDKVNCISGNVGESSVTARQWEIRLERRYRDYGRIRSVSWVSTATIRAESDPRTMSTALQTYLEEVRTDATKPDSTSTTNPYGVETLNASLTNDTCTGRRSPPVAEQPQVVRYEFTCDDRSAETRVGSTLTFKFTHDRTRGFVKPPDDE